MAERFRNKALPVASVVGFLAFWEVAGLAGVSQALPPFHEVLIAFREILVSDRFQEAVSSTFSSILVAFPVTVVVGIFIGVLMALVKPIRWLLDPWVNLGLSLPLVSMIPVIILIFGLDSSSTIAVIVIYTLPILIVNTVSGVQNINPDLMNMGRSFVADRRTMLRRVILPGAAPLVISGIRIAAGRAIKGAIVAEQVVGLIGLGGLIQRLGGAFAVAQLYAVILFVGVVGVASVALIGRLQPEVSV